MSWRWDESELLLSVFGFSGESVSLAEGAVGRVARSPRPTRAYARRLPVRRVAPATTPSQRAP